MFTANPDPFVNCKCYDGCFTRQQARSGEKKKLMTGLKRKFGSGGTFATSAYGNNLYTDNVNCQIKYSKSTVGVLLKMPYFQTWNFSEPAM